MTYNVFSGTLNLTQSLLNLRGGKESGGTGEEGGQGRGREGEGLHHGCRGDGLPWVGFAVILENSEGLTLSRCDITWHTAREAENDEFDDDMHSNVSR